MADSNSSNLIRVVVEVSGSAVEAPAAAPMGAAQSQLTSGRGLGANSPAWHPDAHTLGGFFFAAHKEDNNPESRKTLSALFKVLSDPAGDYDNQRTIQKLHGKVDPVQENTLAPADMGVVAGQLVGETVQVRLNRWVGSVLDPVVPQATLTHAQFVLFWHILRDQEDLKLISPFDPNTLPW
jgi:hypothetical protein